MSNLVREGRSAPAQVGPLTRRGKGLPTTTTAIDVRPIAGSLGAEIRGVRLADGVDEALRA